MTNRQRWVASAVTRGAIQEAEERGGQMAMAQAVKRIDDQIALWNAEIHATNAGHRTYVIAALAAVRDRLLLLKPDNGESLALILHNAQTDGCRDEFKHWCKHLAVEFKCSDPDCPVPFALTERDKLVARECVELAEGIAPRYEAPDGWARVFSAGRDNAAGAIRQRWGLK